MRKLVLGIIVVVCVQFAFVIYMQLQSPLDVTGVPVFPSSPVVNTDLSWLEELDRSGLTVPEPDAPVTRVEPQRSVGFDPSSRVADSVDRPGVTRIAQSPGDRPLKRVKAFFPAPPVAAPSDFETVVISYGRAPRFADCDRFDPPKPRKRSYIARAQVIKKPVVWVRSLAMKLY